jgi:hypothetical protein
LISPMAGDIDAADTSPTSLIIVPVTALDTKEIAR